MKSKHYTNLVIRKISINDPIQGMSFVVGNRAGNFIIEAIEFDDDYHAEFKERRYLIYVDAGNQRFIWKDIIGMPVVLEYDLQPSGLIDI